MTFRLAMLAGVIDRVGQSWLKSDYGLNIRLWRVLGMVAALEPVRFGELVHTLQLDKGQLSRLVKTLAAEDLLSVDPDPSDQRVTIVRLTDKGRATNREVLLAARQRNEQVLSELTPEEADTLVRLLDKLHPLLEHRAHAEETGQSLARSRRSQTIED
ncbi:winged helix DNA-binding protein [Amorphus sp. 3PC139-8]